MSFTPGIPRSGQSLGNSRPQVQGNFDYINTAFAINHVAFNASGVGKHKFMQMPEQVAAPTTLANEGALYTKEAQGITNLFWRQESNGTEIQLTNIEPLIAASGYTFLPGGLLLQWGVTGSIASTSTVNFPIAFPNNTFFTNAIQINAANAAAQRCISVIPNGNASFKPRITTLGSSPIDSSCAIYFFAIGN